MKYKICFLLFNFLFLGGLFAQLDELTLTKGLKEKTIALCDCVDITMHSKVSSSKLLEGSMATTGYVHSMDSDTIYFKTETTLFTMKNLNGNKWTKEVVQLDERSLIPIAINDISLIEYKSTGRDFAWGMSALGIMVSTVLSFVVAPIVGYKFKEDQFDVVKYKRLLLPSISLLAGSTAINILAKPKKYYLQKEGLSAKDLWVIQVD